MPASFKLYFKRNIQIEKNMWRRTLLELVIFFAMLLVISLSPIARSKRILKAGESFEETRKYSSSRLEDLNVLKTVSELKRDKTRYILAYAPEGGIAKTIAEAVVQKLQLNGTIAYESDNVLQMQFDDRTTLAGIVFYGVNGDEVPRTLSVAIRYPSAFRTVDPQLPEERLWVTRCSGVLHKNGDNLRDSNVDTDIYVREGFLQLQHQVFKEWYSRLRAVYPTDYDEPSVELRIIRHRASQESCPLSGVTNVPTFMFNFLFLLPFLNLIWNWAQQHEDNVSLYEWSCGFSFCTLWICNFLVALIHFLILGLITWVVIYVVWGVTSQGSDHTLIFFFMLLLIIMHVIGLILCAMIISKFFAKKVNALLVGLIFWIVNYAVFSIVLQRYWNVSGYYVMVAFIVFINNVFAFSMNLFRRLIDNDRGIFSSDVHVVYLSGLIYIVLQLVILAFMQWRFPGRYLSRNALYRKKYNVKPLSQADLRVMRIARTPSWQNFEFGSVGSEELMRLRNVSTMHKTSDRKIVKNVSLRIYKGEILVLLGHIGSGKLTLMRVICGLKLAYRGSIELLGKNFYDNLRSSRKVIGFRMEQNGLPDYLTVQQVLSLHVTAQMPKDNKDAIQQECAKWWEYLEECIESSTKILKKLSYGQRRLVSLCCCLAGGTKIVVLNEPVQYLTLKETQTYFSILERERASRAIIVSTCSIDDTERIANRIGIFNMGMLEASGTPFFLRGKFGSGVELVLLKKAHVSDEPITEFLQKFIPKLEPDNEIGDQLMYRIEGEKRPIMQQMLIQLEKERKALGIENIRVVGPELTDIYMKLVTSFRLHQQVIPDVTQTFKYSVISKGKLRRQQIRAMLYKKLLHQAPNIWSIIMIVVSVVLIILISQMVKVLALPKTRSNSMHLGYGNDMNMRSFLPDASVCGFVELRDVNRDKSYSKVNAQSHLYSSESFKCGRGDYFSYIRSNKDNSDSDNFNGMGAVDVSDRQNLVAWSSQDVFHAAPITLNVLHNLILQFAYPGNTEIMAKIENHPMPTPLSLKISLLDNQITHINQPLTLGTILPFTIAIFIIPLVEENACNLRILQIIAGIGMNIFWIVTFLWDFFTFFMYSIIFLIVMCFTSISAFSAVEKVLILLLMNVFGIAAILGTYFTSMFFQREVFRAFLICFLVQLMSGLVLFVIYWEVANSSTVFYYMASMSPAFSLLDGVSNIYTQSRETRYCEEKCLANSFCTSENVHEVVPQCRSVTFFQWANPGILPALVFMIVGALVFMLLIFCVELQRKERKFFTSRNLKAIRTVCHPFDDADVADVKMKIAEADMHRCKQSAFLVDQLESEIPKKATQLTTVSFAINKYTSMGIFGARMSGKSHLVRQLIGEEGFCFGEVYVRGLDFKYDLQKVQQYIGYCPQRIGFVQSFTPCEIIRLICMIRGVPDSKITEKIRDLAQMLNMSGWMNRRMGTLTAEKRRKVNVAVSLVAYNKIIILDEPTYGMPATARREIWNILRYIRYCGKTIIFTTTDELECKVLADFTILFEHSEMLAIGSMQYMRYKYSYGFYLEVRLIRDGSTQAAAEDNLRKDIENVTRFVKFIHEKSELIAHRENWLKFFVPVETIIYSYLYGSLEKNKRRLNISDYSVYQASTIAILEHILTQRENFKKQSEVSNLMSMSLGSHMSMQSNNPRSSFIFDPEGEKQRTPKS